MASFGRYEIVNRLGSGSFGTVDRAWDPDLKRHVALKALHANLAEDTQIRERFLAEATSLARLHHRNIVSIYDVGSSAEGQPYFIMQLIEGQTLRTLAAPGADLSLARVMTILEPLCTALDELHQNGLVHRDIKPDNIIVDRAGQPVLMDLGIARDLMGSVGTLSGAQLGTPAYMSPEQVRGEQVTTAADIYALGILTYHLLAGMAPFVGSAFEVMRRQVQEAPPPLADLRPGLPDSVYRALDQALAKNPADRPRTASEFLHALAGESRTILLTPAQRLIVAPDGSGSHTSLAAAVAAAAPAAMIQLRTGSHRLESGLLLRQSVTLVGAGMESTEVVAGEGGHALRYAGRGGFGLRDLTLRWDGPPDIAADVVVVEGGDVAFERCRFTGAADASGAGGVGLLLFGDARGRIAGCIAEGNGYAGIYLDGTAQPRIEATDCSENGDTGLAFYGSAGGTARDCTCASNGTNGIYLDEQAQPALEQNTCRQNRASGIAYFGSAGGSARANTCADNLTNGIYVGGTAQPTLDANTCSGNHDDGISVRDEAAPRLQGNICNANDSDGIFIAASARPQLADNRASGNKSRDVNDQRSSSGPARRR